MHFHISLYNKRSPIPRRGISEVSVQNPSFASPLISQITSRRAHAEGGKQKREGSWFLCLCGPMWLNGLNLRCPPLSPIPSSWLSLLGFPSGTHLGKGMGSSEVKCILSLSPFLPSATSSVPLFSGCLASPISTQYVCM